MAGLDVSRLSPSDCIAALRSFPRRFRARLTGFDEDESPDDLVHRAPAGGHSALEHTDRAARTIEAFAEAVRRVGVEDRPLLGATDSDGWPPDPGALTAESVLDRLTFEVNELAEVAARVASADWARVADAEVAGRRGERGKVTALDLLREAARAGAEGLRAVEQALTAARRP